MNGTKLKQHNAGTKVWDVIKGNPIAVILVLAAIVVGCVVDNFFSWGNLSNLLSNTAVRFLIALGVSGCLITKGTDLSAGRQVGLAACIAGVLCQRGDYTGRMWKSVPEMNIFLVLLIVLAIGFVVGLVNGLAWTSVGGEMLPIEVSIIPSGSGKVEITGSLGDVMKESAHLALTYARVHAETYHIAPDKFKNTDIHIHAPEGAVPKDGPSAGVTLTTALISALSEIPVRHDLAMTGEITLHGNVLPIGGLKEKSMAAFREGISTVLIPEANKPDLYEVDEEVKKAVKFIPVSDLSQVLKHALILPAASAAHKRTMPQATQLIATEQSTAKEPAAVM